jgi:heme exporter protein B
MAYRDTSTGAIAALVHRDLLLAWRRPGEALHPLVFYVMVVVLFPLSLGPETGMLQRIAPGIVWVAALLASMLSLENLFHADFEDGSLEQLLLSRHPLVLLALAKISAHWLVTGLPLLLLAPVLGVLMQLPGRALLVLWQSLLLGTPVLSLIGAVAAALTAARRRGGVLTVILVLPLYLPVLILGAAAADAAAGGLPAGTHLQLLGALLLLSATLAPWAVAAAVRIAVEQG